MTGLTGQGGVSPPRRHGTWTRSDEARWDMLVKRTVFLVSLATDLPAEEIMEKTRRRYIEWPRQVAMYLAFHGLGVPMRQIARVMGLADHSSVSWGIKRVEEELAAPGMVVAMERLLNRTRKLETDSGVYSAAAATGRGRAGSIALPPRRGAYAR